MTAQGRSCSWTPTRAPASTSPHVAWGGWRTHFHSHWEQGWVAPAPLLGAADTSLLYKVESSHPGQTFVPSRRVWKAMICVFEGREPHGEWRFFRSWQTSFQGQLQKSTWKAAQRAAGRGESVVVTSKAPSAPPTRCKQNCCSAEGLGNGCVCSKPGAGTRSRVAPPSAWLENSTNS